MSSLYHIDLSPYHHKNLSGLQAIILLRPLLPAAVKELSVYDIGQVWIEYWILVAQILDFSWSNIEILLIEYYIFYRTQVYLGSDLWVRVSVTEYFCKLYKLYKWPNLQPMQVAPSGGQIWN